MVQEWNIGGSTNKEKVENYRAKTGFKKGRPVEIFNKHSQWSRNTGITPVFNPTLKKVKMTADGTIASSARKAVDLDLSGVKNFKLRVFVEAEDPRDINTILIYLANDTGYANFKVFSIKGYQCVHGWNEFNIDPARATTTGTGSYTAPIVSMQIRVETFAGKTAHVTFDNLLRDEIQKANIIFTFDDAWISQYTEAFKRMQKKGMPGMIGVIGKNIGGKDGKTMSLAQLQEIYDYGWDVVNHTYNHLNLGTLNQEQNNFEIEEGRKALEKLGFTRTSDIVVYPQGGFTDNYTITQVNKRHRAGRTIVESMETTPPVNKAKIKIRNCLNTVPAATVTGWVDEAIASGGTLILLWHFLVTGAATQGTEYPVADFQTIVDYVYSKRDQINIVNFSEWLDMSGL